MNTDNKFNIGMEVWHLVMRSARKAPHRNGWYLAPKGLEVAIIPLTCAW